MYILGIFNGHDSSAALLKDGEVIAAAQEERFNRIKHYAGLPVRAVEFCLKKGKITPSDISYVAIPRLRNAPDIKTLFGNPKSGFLETDELANKGFKDHYRKLFVRVASVLSVGNQFGLPLYTKTYPLGKKARIVQLDHHLSHAASAFYSSGFDRSLVVTADGAGDALSTTVWLGENNTLKPLLKIARSGSLGFFFNVVTEALGWQVSEGEGKTMGLASYGSTEKTKGVLDFCLPIFETGRLKKPHNFGFPKLWIDSGVYHWHFQESEKVKELINKYGREDIAAEAQRCLEEQIVNLIKPYLKKLGIRKLSCAGGVFLNVKMNQFIWESCDLDDFFIYPDAGDAGVPVGAALYTYYNYANIFNRTRKQIKSVYYGSGYSDKEIEYYLKLQKIKYEKVDRKTLINRTANLLSKGKIISWFQGDMEIGPRALGNRSILMDPRKSENKDIINKQVKFREGFRPFTPSMTKQAAQRFLRNPRNAPFMIISFDANPAEVDKIPAVVHVDGTVRPQILERNVNPLYFDLIEEFGNITGVPVLLNTSFNIKGEPIVESPRDAIKCFFDTGLDYLVIGSFMISK